MKKSELPLYLKISSIYNKILQLAIAVIGIVVLMNLWLQSEKQQEQVIKDNFTLVSKHVISQAKIGVEALLKQEDKDALKAYIQKISENELIFDVHYYDDTGLLVASSINGEIINELYQSKSDSENSSLTRLPFIEEVYQDKLLGYLRLTVNQGPLTTHLDRANFSVHETMRLLMICALVIGFFLTRSLSRFSRAGFRVAK